MTSLIHYADRPVTFDRERAYDQGEPYSGYDKPVGLWVSVTGEDDWPSWCRGEEFGVDRLAVAHRVIVAPDANILTLTSTVGIDSLTARFAVQTEFDRQFHWRVNERAKWPIDWRRVAAEFDGLIIAPYQWSRRYTHDWYYGWDCASGCIWSIDAIASVEPVTLPAAGVRA